VLQTSSYAKQQNLEIAFGPEFPSTRMKKMFVGEGAVFDWLVSICGLGVIVIWDMICIVHIRFRKAYLSQGFKIADLPFKAWLFPYGILSI
jgi:amino acid permease